MNRPEIDHASIDKSEELLARDRILLVLLFFFGSLFGLVSGPHLFDAGELVAAAVDLGGSHQPGQPLHAFLAHSFARLIPLGSITFRISLLSLVCGLWAAERATELGTSLLRQLDAPEEEAKQRSLPLWSLRWSSAFLFAGVYSLPTLQRQATRPEVYSLALLLFVLGLRSVLNSPRAFGGIFLAGLLYAVHPPHALALGVVWFLAFCANQWSLRRETTADWWIKSFRIVAPASFLLLMGLMVLIYLPLRAKAGAVVWGEPTDFQGFIDYITAKAYRRNLGAGTRGPFSLVGDLWIYALERTLFIPLLAVVVSLAHPPRLRDALGKIDANKERAVLAAIVGAGFAGFLQPLDDRNPDNIAYAGPLLTTVLVVSWATCHWVFSRIAHSAAFRRSVPWMVGIFPLVVMARSFGNRDAMQEAPYLETYAFMAADVPKPESLVVVRSDFLMSAFAESRTVDRLRPDLAVLVEGLSTSSWHWRTLGGPKNGSQPIFDGTPVRAFVGPGEMPWVHGAMRSAASRIPVFVEDDEVVRGFGNLRGPYLASIDLSDGAHNERLADSISTDPHYFGGDRGTAFALVRQYQIRRAVRKLERGHVQSAFASLAMASRDLPPTLRQVQSTALNIADAELEHFRPIPSVANPVALYADPFDAFRMRASWLASFGLGERALHELSLAIASGDGRSLLQRAWIRDALGDSTGAKEDLEAWVQATRADLTELQQMQEVSELAQSIVGHSRPSESSQ